MNRVFKKGCSSTDVGLSSLTSSENTAETTINAVTMLGSAPSNSACRLFASTAIMMVRSPW